MAESESKESGVVEEITGSVPIAPPVPLLDVASEEKKKLDEEKQQLSPSSVLNALVGLYKSCCVLFISLCVFVELGMVLRL